MAMGYDVDRGRYADASTDTTELRFVYGSHYGDHGGGQDRPPVTVPKCKLLCVFGAGPLFSGFLGVATLAWFTEASSSRLEEDSWSSPMPFSRSLLALVATSLVCFIFVFGVHVYTRLALSAKRSLAQRQERQRRQQRVLCGRENTVRVIAPSPSPSSLSERDTDGNASES